MAGSAPRRVNDSRAPGSEFDRAPHPAGLAPAAPEPEPACVRKVKVVYAGYAGATGCAPAEGER